MLSQRQYMTVTIAIFTIVGIMHALRLLFNWPLIIGLTFMPMWVSWVGLAIAVLLVASATKIMKK